MSRKETRSNVREWDDYYARPRWQEPQSMGLLGTYRTAATFLDQPGAVIQDWGGGTGYAARYFTNAARYQVIDGSFNTPASENHGLIVADLATFTPAGPPDGILLRHVLTHCHHGQWRAVLANLVRSTTARAVVILAHPYAETHQVVLRSNRKSSYDEQQFTREEIWDVIYEAEREMSATERLAVSERAYRHEQMIYLARGEENISALPAPSWLIPRNGAWTAAAAAAAEIQAEEKEGSSSHAG